MIGISSHTFRAGALTPADADALNQLRDMLNRLRFTGTPPVQVAQDVGGVRIGLLPAAAAAAGIEVKETDGSPDYTGVTVLLFNQAAGFSLTQPASGQAQVALDPFVASGASHKPGGVPDPGAVAGTTNFLREDATWTTANVNIKDLFSSTLYSGVVEIDFDAAGTAYDSTKGDYIFSFNSTTKVLKIRLNGFTGSKSVCESDGSLHTHSFSNGLFKSGT